MWRDSHGIGAVMMRTITSDNVIAWIVAGNGVAIGEWKRVARMAGKGIGESVRECVLGERKLIAIGNGNPVYGWHGSC